MSTADAMADVCYAGATIRVKRYSWDRKAGESLVLNSDTGYKHGSGKVEGFAGVVPKVIPLPEEYKTVRQYGPFS